MQTRGAVVSCLVLIILALQVVGLVSHTTIRHLVQTSPLMLAIVLAYAAPAWSRPAAMPLFLFWLGIVILIWLFLLNLAHVVNGTFTPVEVAMTIVMGIACVVGIWGSARQWRVASVTVFVLFAALQWLAFRVSFLPAIQHR